MNKEVQLEEVVKEEKEISLKNATVDQLKVAAFDIDQQIKGLQNNLQTIFTELNLRNKDK